MMVAAECSLNLCHQLRTAFFVGHPISCIYMLGQVKVGCILFMIFCSQLERSRGPERTKWARGVASMRSIVTQGCRLCRPHGQCFRDEVEECPVCHPPLCPFHLFHRLCSNFTRTASKPWFQSHLATVRLLTLPASSRQKCGDSPSEKHGYTVYHSPRFPERRDTLSPTCFSGTLPAFLVPSPAGLKHAACHF